MKSNRRASQVAWVVVALLVAILGVQAWPEHQDPHGGQSQVGIVH